jgi:flagellar hook-basal body complex protein FliE
MEKVIDEKQQEAIRYNEQLNSFQEQNDHLHDQLVQQVQNLENNQKNAEGKLNSINNGFIF